MFKYFNLLIKDASKVIHGYFKGVLSLVKVVFNIDSKEYKDIK